jgi:predicted transcriptional regulator
MLMQERQGGCSVGGCHLLIFSSADRRRSLQSGALGIGYETPYVSDASSGAMTDARSLAPHEANAEEKAQRFAHEAGMIPEAPAAVAAGRTVSLESVSAWVDSLGTDHELPPQQSDH